MLTLLRALSLAARIHAAHPELPIDRVQSAAVAIIAESRGWDPLLVAAIAIRESRLDWRADNGKGCHGPMQVCGRGRPRSERHGYQMGVRRLDESRAYCPPCSLLSVLAGYASGPAGVRGRWYAQPRAVLAERERLARAGGGA